ncbi:hypothetical protein UC34_14140 [Pandoraea vervacti]|uniref:Uncharacterized protein n=1 Tax=Pandoraea vervacti TaxID=656178 RepID=A0ABN4FZA6_9BURK|nr:hypothetical protein UC34_14140 [Pandoraea vervacti]
MTRRKKTVAAYRAMDGVRSGQMPEVPGRAHRAKIGSFPEIVVGAGVGRARIDEMAGGICDAFAEAILGA